LIIIDRHEWIMIENFRNILYLIAAGALLIGGVFVLRFVLKLAWKFVRAALIILSIVTIAGFFLGFLEIGLR